MKTHWTKARDDFLRTYHNDRGKVASRAVPQVGKAVGSAGGIRPCSDVVTI
jgi:hypothetical protein